MKVDDGAANKLDSTSSANAAASEKGVSKWLRLGLVAAVSAAAGGIAAVWLYRESVKKLHESGELQENTDSHRIHYDDWPGV
jgi:hypothetical protein